MTQTQRTLSPARIALSLLLFVVAYVVLTIVGSFFRGQQMILMWPWDPRQVRIE